MSSTLYSKLLPELAKIKNSIQRKQNYSQQSISFIERLLRYKDLYILHVCAFSILKAVHVTPLLL